MGPVSESFVSYVDLKGWVEGTSIRPDQALTAGRKVSQVPTDQASRRLAERSEESRNVSRLSQMMPSLAPKFERIKQLLGFDTAAAPRTFEPRSVIQCSLPEAIRKACREQAMTNSGPALSCAEKLEVLAGEGLELMHLNLVSGADDGIRRVITSLENLRKNGPEELRGRAGALLEKTVGNLPFSQWGTTGPQGPRSFLEQARAESLATAALQMNQIAVQVLQLRDDIESCQAGPHESAGPARASEQIIKGSREVLRGSTEKLAELELTHSDPWQKVKTSRSVSPRMLVLDKMLKDMGDRVGRFFRPSGLQGSGSGWGMIPDRERGFRPMFRQDFNKLVKDLRSIVPSDAASEIECRALLDEKITSTLWRLKKGYWGRSFSWQARQQFSEWAEKAVQLIEASKKGGA